MVEKFANCSVSLVITFMALGEKKNDMNAVAATRARDTKFAVRMVTKETGYFSPGIDDRYFGIFSQQVMIGVQKVISVSFPGTVSFDTMTFPLLDTVAEEAGEEAEDSGEKTSFSDASFGCTFGRTVSWTLCFGFGTDC